MEQPTVKVKSADRVLDILELFIGKIGSYSLTDISKLLSMPPSSTHQILQNMLARGYLEMDETGKQFRLGYKLFEIRTEYTKNTDMKREFYRVADSLSSDLNEMVLLAIRSADKVLYIAEKQSSQALRITGNLGAVLPLYVSASGKIFLAQLTDEEIDEIYPNEELEMLTKNTIPTKTILKQQLQHVRLENIAYNLGESVDELRCIAGAICNVEGKAVASLSITIPLMRVTDEKWSKMLDGIKRSCEEISKRVFC
ncbi:helix-turn-helix domain-containing protein [Paenibacillus sp. LMG 31461]|uniref:Helix-turn-helix domain-containing protein n=1 Tax=Paenibacillus plantarum TaxID=2654975 RepID=A0ABX1XHK3_9BACL|nr:IclR family transcriptional regulator [Paenibacillus plantarum]NOU67373.1 helix-turn-helix domain-containing protein [Paenibacillus plantarum]